MNFWITLVTAALFIAGCGDRAPTLTVPVASDTNATEEHVPQTVHRKIKLKEVQDNNYSSEYMYPEDKVKKEKMLKDTQAETVPDTNTTTVVNGMSKDECVNMIGQEKFDKYTQMFGNEVSSIKRCAMLKAMQ